MGFVALNPTYILPMLSRNAKPNNNRFQNRAPKVSFLIRLAVFLASGDVPFNDLDADGDVVGMGDLSLRFFLQIDPWRFRFPVYDFEDEEFSFWVGPELGKIVKDGLIFYGKPGFGVDPDEKDGDRKFSFEVGFRYFIK